MRGGDILVATPGRLLDHLSSPDVSARLSSVSTLVYDEVDRLLEEGFKRELDAIVELLPKNEDVARQRLMYSATIDDNVKQVCIVFRHRTLPAVLIQCAGRVVAFAAFVRIHQDIQ